MEVPRNGVIPRPRCGRKLRPYRLNRPRGYDYGEVPVCGLPEDHARKDHLSEEALQRIRDNRKERRDWGN